MNTEAVQASPEIPSSESTMRRVRHNLAQSHGLDVAEQPAVLDALQKAAVSEHFLDYQGEITRSEDFFARYGGVNNLVSERFEKEKLPTLKDMEPGTVVSLVKPPRLPANPGQLALDGKAGPVVRALAVSQALNVLGLSGAEARTALEQADVQVFPSPYNGAPVINERVVHVGDYSVYEMNLFATGDIATPIDSQVTVIRNPQ